MMEVDYSVVYYQWANHCKNPSGRELYYDLGKVRFKND